MNTANLLTNYPVITIIALAAIVVISAITFFFPATMMTICGLLGVIGGTGSIIYGIAMTEDSGTSALLLLATLRFEAITAGAGFIGAGLSFLALAGALVSIRRAVRGPILAQ